MRRRLSAKGIRVSVMCPMCMRDIEHMCHLFYDCPFAVGCWSHVGLQYDWSNVELASDWVLLKLSTATTEEILNICVIIWGIWQWRNKRVWDGRIVTSEFARDRVLKCLQTGLRRERLWFQVLRE